MCHHLGKKQEQPSLQGENHFFFPSALINLELLARRGGAEGFVHL